MFILLLSGDGTILSETTTRAQLPLLLNQLVVTTNYAVDIAIETDTALTATVFSGAALIPAEVAVETDTGLDATVLIVSDLAISVTPAFETDTSFAPTLVTSGDDIIQVSLAEVTDTAFSLTLTQNRMLPINLVTGLTLTPVTLEDDELLTPAVPV